MRSSLFALLYALLNARRYYRHSAHGLGAKAAVTVQLGFLWINLGASLLTPSTFYLA